MARMSQRTALSTILGVSVLVCAASANADVILEPNVIKGQAFFTNTNPAVVSLLQQLGMSSASISGSSTSPTGYWSSTTASLGTPVARSFELSAESGAGGPGGVTYTLNATGITYANAPYSAYGNYWFQPLPGVVLQPIAQQPNGAVGNLGECVGIVRVRFGLDAACNQPVTVDSGSITTSYSWSQFQNTSEHYILQLGGTNETKYLSITVGNDPTLNTITTQIPVTLSPKCDEIQDICIDISGFGAGGDQLGGLRGPYDVLGETELNDTFIMAYSGPAGNQRYGYFLPPEMPVANPGVWWKLPNMVPGDYYGYALGYVRSGRQTTTLRSPAMGPGMPSGPMTVTAGTYSDLQQIISGQPRYPFVMSPAHFKGNILLADPYITSNPAAYSSLSALRFSADPPYTSTYPAYTLLVAHDNDTGMGYSVTSFDGNFDQSTGTLASFYDQLVANTYDLPTQWRQDGLNLDFYDPAQKREGAITINRDPSNHLLSPGNAVAIDHPYCFNEVELPYSIVTGQLFDPNAMVSGNFNGVDWQMQASAYSVSGQFRGWPQGANNAATNGTVHLALPQGQYIIQPGAHVISPGGAISQANFASTNLELGCGQRLVVTPGLSVSASLPLCAPSATPTLTGTVSSNGAPVDHIWYTLNGGPAVDICASGCGANPSFSTALNLASCGNTVEVFATSGGQTVSVTTQTIWEVAGDGLDCTGECPEIPVEDTCATVEAETIACSGGDGGYGLTLQITNHTNQPIEHVLIPDAHVSPHVITLPTPLAPGGSTTVSVSLDSVNPGSELCFNMGFTNASQEECCSQEVCVDVPACCFGIESEKTNCIPGAPGGTFQYSFNFENRTLDTIEHLFLLPPQGVTATPNYVDVPSTPPGGTAFVGPVTFSGATPGDTLCVAVGIHDQELEQCCEDEVCFTVPQPCGIIKDPKDPTVNLKGEGSAEACSVSASTKSSPLAPLFLALSALGVLARRRRLK